MVIQLSIPTNTHLHIEPDQKIALGDPIAQESATEECTLAISKPLGIKPNDIFQWSSVIVGDSVEKGDIIAQRKHFLGLKKVVSSTKGIVKGIDHTAGTIILSKQSEATLEVVSPVYGTISAIAPEEGYFSIDIGEAESFDATGSADCGGLKVVLTPKDFFSCDADDVAGACMCMHTSQLHITSKMDALGALSILSVDGNMPDLPHIRVDEKDFDKISQSTMTHVVYSMHDRKVYLYTPKI